MNLKIHLICSFVLFTCSLSAQDLEDIFNDREREMSVNVGTSVTAWFSGLANIEGDLRTFDNRMVTRVGVGTFPFGYFRTFDQSEQTTVFNNGYMLHGGTNIQVVGKGTDRDFGLLIGPRFEMIEFIGTNSWEREEMSNSGFYANGSPVYQLAYHRRTMNLGLTLGGLFSMSSRFSLSMGIVGGFGRVYAKYNEHYSYNTTWNSNAPQSWFAMKGGVPYMRFVIGVYYKISK